MTKRWIGILLAILLLPLAVHAQNADLPELTETWTTDTFSLNYPADWMPSKELDGNFSIPIAGEGAVGDGIALSREDLTATFSLVSREKLTAHDLALEVAQDWAASIPDYALGVVLDATINEREATFADVSGMFPVRFVVLALGNDQYLQVMLVGVPEQFTAVMPTLWAVLDSARLDGDDTLPSKELTVQYTLAQAHQRKGYWNFSIPADWTTQEADTYTLLVIPGIETTIGVSAVNDDFAADLHVWGDQVYQNVTASAPDVEYDEKEFMIGEYPTLQQNFRLVSEGLGFTEFIAYAGEDVQINISVIGPLPEVSMLIPVVQDIIVTVVVDN
ncbi:MAG: hypothetical protein H6672_06755 [Anaerolineaceae bacterium]|nr:hypothetical protein [Anaerolineaceae bacterium]